jgi:predicted kinase
MVMLTILRGASGSGKSKWAEQQQGRVVVSRDKIRMALFGSESMQNENLVTKVQDAMIEASLRDGQDVIVDNTNIEVKYMRPIAELGMFCGAEVGILTFDKSLLECLTNNAARANDGGRNVPADVIEKQWKRLQATKDITVADLIFNDFEPVEEDDSLLPVVIIDIDGTLAHNVTGRSPFDEARVLEDEIDPAVQEIAFAMIKQRVRVIFMSGRSKVCEGDTAQWLWNHSLKTRDTYLFMREAGDSRRDYLVKYDLFNEHVRDKFNVLFVIDDRWQVRQMWQKIGLKVFDASTDGGRF